MVNWKRSGLAALLCAGLLGGNLPVLAANLDGLNLSAQRMKQLENAKSGDYAVSPETARAYLNAIEQREQEIAEIVRWEEENGYSDDPWPLDTWLIDLDGDGDGELYMYDNNRPNPLDFAPGIWKGKGVIRSAEGESLSFGGGYDSTSRPCTILIDPPYVGVFYDIGANSMTFGEAYATLYRYENGQMTTLNKWFFNYTDSMFASESDEQVTISYTDATGKIISHTGTARELQGLRPDIDPLAQMIEGAKAYGADLTNPLISNSGQGYYSNFMPTEQVKDTLQAIVEAADQGAQLLHPGDPVFQDVADTVAVWDALFTNAPFDLSVGDVPQAEGMFDWWADPGMRDGSGTPVVSPGDPAALDAFIQTLEPESASRAEQLVKGNTSFAGIYQTDDAALAQVCQALFGSAFDVDAIYEHFYKDTYIPLKGQDEHWYVANVMVPMGGHYSASPVSAVSDLGDGIYAAYLTGMDQSEECFYDGLYHMLLQKSPEGATLPYQILSLGEGMPVAAEVAALKARILEPNTRYDYTVIAAFGTKKEYLDYLEEQLDGLDGQPINDKGKLETAKYIQVMYENAVFTQLATEENRVVLGLKQMETIAAELSELLKRTESLLDKYNVTLNRMPQVTIRVFATQLDWGKPIEVELEPDILSALQEMQTLRVVLDHSGVGFSIQMDALPSNTPVRFSIRCQNDIYSLNFKDGTGAEITRSPIPVTLYLPAQTPLASVELQYNGNHDNWGGQYDANSGLIFFSTQWSGLYQVVENTVEITDIGQLTEEQQRIIRFMVSKGFFQVRDGNFYPDSIFSRYDFAKALVGMFYALDRDATCIFTDVPKDGSEYPYVASAFEAGIAEGIGNNLFAGDRAVTREQAIAFCARTLVEKKGYLLPENLNEYGNFSDRDQISQWAMEYIALAEQLGLIEGGGMLVPQGEMTCAESAELLYRMFMLLYEVTPIQMQTPELSDTVASETAPAQTGGTAISVICLCGAAIIAIALYCLRLTSAGKRWFAGCPLRRQKMIMVLGAVLIAGLLCGGLIMLVCSDSGAAPVITMVSNAAGT